MRDKLIRTFESLSASDSITFLGQGDITGLGCNHASSHALANGSPGMPMAICHQSVCSCCADSIGPFVCFTPILLQVRNLGNRLRRPTDIRFTALYLEDYMGYMINEPFRGFKVQTHASYLRVVLRPTERSWAGTANEVLQARHTLENRSLDNSKRKCLPR